MKRFRLYWGNHSIRTRHTLEELLDWAERFLHDCHANVFDGEEYICTLHVGERGSITYVVDGIHTTRDEIVGMCTDIIID